MQIISSETFSDLYEKQPHLLVVVHNKVLDEDLHVLISVEEFKKGIKPNEVRAFIKSSCVSSFKDEDFVVTYFKQVSE